MTFDPNRQPNPFPPTPDGRPAPGAPAPAPVPQQPLVPSFIPPTVAAAAANPTARRGVSAGTIAFVAAIVIAAAGLGFAGGRLTAPATPTRGGFGGNFAGNFGNGSFQPNASGNPNRGGFGGFGGGNVSIDGQVTAIANGSITIQTASGQSVTLQVPSTVTYHSQAAATSSDVAVGSNVQVSITRGARGETSGQPGPSGAPGAGQGGGFNTSVTDITVLSK